MPNYSNTLAGRLLDRIESYSVPRVVHLCTRFPRLRQAVEDKLVALVSTRLEKIRISMISLVNKVVLEPSRFISKKFDLKKSTYSLKLEDAFSQELLGLILSGLTNLFSLPQEDGSSSSPVIGLEDMWNSIEIVTYAAMLESPLEACAEERRSILDEKALVMAAIKSYKKAP